ncbi:hypothetical protein Hanom_Chr12g01110961 [Helianthus anomalus]
MPLNIKKNLSKLPKSSPRFGHVFQFHPKQRLGEDKPLPSDLSTILPSSSKRLTWVIFHMRMKMAKNPEP